MIWGDFLDPSGCWMETDPILDKGLFFSCLKVDRSRSSDGVGGTSAACYGGAPMVQNVLTTFGSVLELPSGGTKKGLIFAHFVRI